MKYLRMALAALKVAGHFGKVGWTYLVAGWAHVSPLLAKLVKGVYAKLAKKD